MDSQRAVEESHCARPVRGAAVRAAVHPDTPRQARARGQQRARETSRRARRPRPTARSRADAPARPRAGWARGPSRRGAISVRCPSAPRAGARPCHDLRERRERLRRVEPDSAQGRRITPGTRGLARPSRSTPPVTGCGAMMSSAGDDGPAGPPRRREPFEDLRCGHGDSGASRGAVSVTMRPAPRRLRAACAAGCRCAAKRMQACAARAPVARERDERPGPQRAHAVEVVHRRRDAGDPQVGDDHVGDHPASIVASPGTSGACVTSQPASRSVIARERPRVVVVVYEDRDAGHVAPARGPRCAGRGAHRAAARAPAPARRSARGGVAPRAPDRVGLPSAAITAMRDSSAVSRSTAVSSCRRCAPP